MWVWSHVHSPRRSTSGEFKAMYTRREDLLPVSLKPCTLAEKIYFWWVWSHVHSPRISPSGEFEAMYTPREDLLPVRLKPCTLAEKICFQWVWSHVRSPKTSTSGGSSRVSIMLQWPSLQLDCNHTFPGLSVSKLFFRLCDGKARLYATDCGMCHGPSSTSTRKLTRVNTLLKTCKEQWNSSLDSRTCRTQNACKRWIFQLWSIEGQEEITFLLIMHNIVYMYDGRATMFELDSTSRTREH